MKKLDAKEVYHCNACCSGGDGCEVTVRLAKDHDPIVGCLVYDNGEIPHPKPNWTRIKARAKSAHNKHKAGSLTKGN